jgi:poly-gamma-glutamate synthesis protein (capsule biosynthesis protein)
MPQSTIVGGVRVGFLAVTQFLNLPQGRDYVGVVNYEDRKSAERFLSFVREVSLSYDIFIVSFHGDREYVGEPSAGKREFFRRIAENGATIVYGHHPHVIQRYETVKGGGGDRLIMYSMGNFVSGMSFRLDPAEPSAISAASGESFLLSVEVRCEGGRASVVRLSPIPVANYRNERGEVVVRRMEQLIGDSAGISPAWRSYFTERFRRMADFLARGGPLDPRDAIGFSRLESVP